MSCLGLLVAQSFAYILFIQFLVYCADSGLTVSRDFLSILRDSDQSIFVRFWLESKNIDQHVTNVEEHLLFMVEDENFTMDQRVDYLDYSQFFQFCHVSQG